MRRHMNRGCLAVLVSGFCLLGFQGRARIHRPTRKHFVTMASRLNTGATDMRTELKAERRSDAFRALAAFGVRGHAESAATAIVEAIKEYGEDAYGGDAKDATPDQKLIQTAIEAVVKIGPAAFDIVLRNSKDANVRRFAKEVYINPFADKRVNVLSASAVRTLLEHMQAEDLKIREFAGDLLGEAIRDYPPSKDNALTVLQEQKDTGRLVRSLIEVLLDEKKFSYYQLNVIETFGPRAKATASALVKARLRDMPSTIALSKPLALEQRNWFRILSRV